MAPPDPANLQQQQQKKQTKQPDITAKDTKLGKSNQEALGEGGQPDRSKAEGTLEEFRNTSEDTIDSERAWLSANWAEYLGDTSQNPRLGWSKDMTSDVLVNTAGNFLSKIPEAAIVKGGAAAVGALIGTAACPVAGTVIGFIAGVLIESAVGWIWDAIQAKSGNDDVEKAAAEASVLAAKLIGQMLSEFNVGAAASKGDLRKVVETQKKAIKGATDQATLDKITADLAGEKKAQEGKKFTEGDRSLHLRMIKDWVLEHAGDEEDANKSTSEAQWTMTMEKAKEKGALAKGEDLDNHPELFAYQTRRHWADAGLDSGPSEARLRFGSAWPGCAASRTRRAPRLARRPRVSRCNLRASCPTGMRSSMRASLATFGAPR